MAKSHLNWTVVPNGLHFSIYVKANFIVFTLLLTYLVTTKFYLWQNKLFMSIYLNWISCARLSPIVDSFKMVA